jgi:hypothetical protein
MSESYEAPRLTVLGEIEELTEGSTGGAPDGVDGVGSVEDKASDIRLKRDVQAI